MNLVDPPLKEPRDPSKPPAPIHRSEGDSESDSGDENWADAHDDFVHASIADLRGSLPNDFPTEDPAFQTPTDNLEGSHTPSVFQEDFQEKNTDKFTDEEIKVSMDYYRFFPFYSLIN